LQVLNYRINAVIISLFLAGPKSDLRYARKALGYLAGTIQPEWSAVPAGSENLLKGQQLLEALAREMAAYANQPAKTSF
jgi:hypothetical protein